MEAARSFQNPSAIGRALEKFEESSRLPPARNHLPQNRVHRIRIGNEVQPPGVKRRLTPELRCDERSSGVERFRNRSLEESSNRLDSGRGENRRPELLVRDRLPEGRFREPQVLLLPSRLRSGGRKEREREKKRGRSRQRHAAIAPRPNRVENRDRARRSRPGCRSRAARGSCSASGSHSSMAALSQSPRVSRARTPRTCGSE